ncbi:MAG: sulfatase-like hydrolase/transferase, partial [Balneolaceae bacterium]|nr:sulfatase-like hydrolase/transferase [Balneolaceae bacterium]
MRRAQLITVLILIFISFQIGCTNPQTEEKKPNILFFFVDDMGWQDTSVPFYEETTELNERYHTPNMETLAEQGMKFTQAYAAAVCSPSRISLMTGMSMARHGVTNWTLHKGQSPDD